MVETIARQRGVARTTTRSERRLWAGRGNFIWIVGVVRFAVATGLRKGELRHLRWSDVDMEQSRIYVRSRLEGKTKANAVRSHQGFQTKVGSNRTLPIFPMTILAADVDAFWFHLDVAPAEVAQFPFAQARGHREADKINNPDEVVQ